MFSHTRMFKLVSAAFIFFALAPKLYSTPCDKSVNIACVQVNTYKSLAHYYRAPQDLRPIWKKLANLDAPPFEKSIAFLVGVGKYSRLPSLGFVYNDINEMRSFLLNEEQFTDVYVLLDDDVTANALRAIMVNIFANGVVGQNDRFLFYYSGHGFAESDAKGHMLFGGATPGLYEPEYDLPVSEITLWSTRLQAKHVLFLLDGCSLGFGLISKGAYDVRSMLSSNGSRIAFAATRGAENSFGTYDNQHSLFTHEFLDVLRSDAADPYNTGVVTIDQISSLLKFRLANSYASSGLAGVWKHSEPVTLDPSRNGMFIFLRPLKSGRTALASSGLGGSKSSVVQNTQVGVINVQDAIVNTREGKKEFEALQSRFAPGQAELKRISQEIEVFEKGLPEDTKKRSAEESRKLNRMKLEFQRRFDDTQNEFQNLQQELMNKIGMKMIDILEKYAKQNGYSIILDTSAEEKDGEKEKTTTPLSLSTKASSDVVMWASASFVRQVQLEEHRPDSEIEQGIRHYLITHGVPITAEIVRAYNDAETRTNK